MQPTTAVGPLVPSTAPAPLYPISTQNSGMPDLSQRHLIWRAVRRRCWRYSPFLIPGGSRPKNRGGGGPNRTKSVRMSTLEGENFLRADLAIIIYLKKKPPLLKKKVE